MENWKEIKRQELSKLYKACSSMNVIPSGILFIGDYDKDYWDLRGEQLFVSKDMKHINIPIFYTRDLSFLEVDGNSCPWMPLFSEENLEVYSFEISKFRRTYNEN